jgi:Cation transporting ATPase, C-terminus
MDAAAYGNAAHDSGQVFYLLNSKYLPVGIGGVVILQPIFTYAPPQQAMFGSAALPLRIWPWLLAAGLAFFLVVEAEKLVIRSSAFLRRAVLAAEAGT